MIDVWKCNKNVKILKGTNFRPFKLSQFGSMNPLLKKKNFFIICLLKITNYRSMSIDNGMKHLKIIRFFHSLVIIIRLIDVLNRVLKKKKSTCSIKYIV